MKPDTDKYSSQNQDRDKMKPDTDKYTVNQLIFAAIMFRVFLLQDSFAEI